MYCFSVCSPTRIFAAFSAPRVALASTVVLKSAVSAGLGCQDAADTSSASRAMLRILGTATISPFIHFRLFMPSSKPPFLKTIIIRCQNCSEDLHLFNSGYIPTFSTCASKQTYLLYHVFDPKTCRCFRCKNLYIDIRPCV